MKECQKCGYNKGKKNHSCIAVLNTKLKNSVPINKLQELIQADLIARTICGQSTKVIKVSKIQKLIDENSND